MRSGPFVVIQSPRKRAVMRCFRVLPAAKNDPPPAEEGLTEEALVEPEPGALELPAQLVEDVTGEGIGEDVAEDILLAIAESGVSGGEAGLAGGGGLAG